MLEVNGAAIDASAGLKLIPTSAVLRAAQSFAPSPQNPTKVLLVNFNYIYLIRLPFSSGLILAYTLASSSKALKNLLGA